MESLYQHFRKEEQPLLDRVNDWVTQVEGRHQVILTPFLDPREQLILQSVAGRSQLAEFTFFGGYEGAERVRALLYPHYYQPEEADFQIGALKVVSSNRVSTLKHPDYLGAFMNIGLKREKFGDILVQQEQAQILISVEMMDYLRLSLERVGNEKVSLQAIPLAEVKPGEEPWEEGACTVTSLRLDVVLSEIFHLSRSKVREYLTQGYVKHNWKVETRGALEVAPGDLLSLRSFGRCRLLELEGMSKRGKFRLSYERLRS